MTLRKLLLTGLLVLVSAVVAGWYVWSRQSKAEGQGQVICLHPIWEAILELEIQAENGLISESEVQANSEYLFTKYCRVVHENLEIIESIPFADGCYTNTSSRLGEIVYWTSCETRPTSKAYNTAPDN